MLHQEIGSFFTPAFVGFEIDVNLHIGDDPETIDVTAFVEDPGVVGLK